jgi:hypothetical protein
MPEDHRVLGECGFKSETMELQLERVWQLTITFFDEWKGKTVAWNYCQVTKGGSGTRAAG